MIPILPRSFLLLFCSWCTKIIYIKWQLHNKSASSAWVHRASQEVPEVAKPTLLTDNWSKYYILLLMKNLCWVPKVCAQLYNVIWSIFQRLSHMFPTSVSSSMTSLPLMYCIVFWPSPRSLSIWGRERIELPESWTKKKTRNSLRWDLYRSSAINVKKSGPIEPYGA